jgi:capsular exopolysaccharide synthesis family protein
MTSANLAITLARSGGRVLLVDADLRRGVMHERFNCTHKPGFSEVLMGQATWTEATLQTETPGLTLMPRGSTTRHPGELFVTGAKDKFLADIAGKYDYIIFDTAPVMAADDVSNLAPYVDGVIMVVRANHTSGRVARAALDILYQRKTNLLGVVFNAVRTRSSEYYYYHYKDYYAKDLKK